MDNIEKAVTEWLITITCFNKASDQLKTADNNATNSESLTRGTTLKVII